MKSTRYGFSLLTALVTLSIIAAAVAALPPPLAPEVPRKLGAPERVKVVPETTQTDPKDARWHRLFEKRRWYAAQRGREREFVGELTASRPPAASTLMRTSLYRLGEWRIYTAARKHKALDKFVGRKVVIRGKAVEMTLEGRHLKEIWPAAIRPAGDDEKEGVKPETKPGPKGAVAVATLRGLSVTVKPTQKAFGPKDMLKFTVTFKCVRPVGLMIYDGDFIAHYKYTFENVKTRQVYTAAMRGMISRMPPNNIVLAPGKSKVVTAMLSPALFGFTTKGAKAVPKPVGGRNVIALHPSGRPMLRRLPPGTYRATLGFKFRSHPQAHLLDTIYGFWTGALNAGPVEVVITAR